MKTLSNVITSAADGADSAAKKIGAVGLSIEDLSGKTQEEQFSAVVAALQDMESGAERTAAANALLGRSAVDMAAVLNMSEEETEALKQEVHDYGMIMSDDAVKASAAFEDSLTKLNNTVSGAKNSLISELLPGVTTVMDGISDFAAGNENAENEILNGIENISDKFTSAVDTIITGLTEKLPEIFSIGIKIVENIADSIVKNAPILIQSAAEMITSLVNGIADGAQDISAAAADIVTFLTSTVSDNTDTLEQRIGDHIIACGRIQR